VHIEVPPSSGKAAAECIPRLRAVASEYAPLIHSAQALERLRANPLRDQESDAYNEPYFLDFLQRELSRSRRHRRRLGLLALELEGVQAFQRAFGYRMAQGLLRDLVEALRGLLRDHDVVAHVGEFQLFVGLPDTDRLGCRVVAEKVRKGLRQLDYLRERLDRYHLLPHIGYSCFPEDGRDRDALLTAALSGSRAARRDPFLRREWKDRPFWPTLESIMKSPGREEVEKTDETAHGVFPTSFLYLLQEAIANDIARHPSRRGLLYIGTNNIYVTEALIQKNPHLAKATTRISVLGDLAGMQSLKEFNINAVAVSKDLASTFQFVIHLSDLHAYAICAILKRQDQWEGFHTSNDSLVEDLIFKLRDEYGLQEQI
jgi:diguanylate cyclase (GGDEF)-like protein